MRSELRIRARSGCLAIWVKPPKYRNAEACKQGDDLQADCHPVPDRRGISLNSPLRRGCEQPVQKITTAEDVRDSSLDKARPKRAAAIEAQIDRNDASENFIEEKLHSKNPLIKSRCDAGPSCPPGVGASCGHALSLLGLVRSDLALVQLQENGGLLLGAPKGPAIPDRIGRS
jgi:hypothetical protein